MSVARRHCRLIRFGSRTWEPVAGRPFRIRLAADVGSRHEILSLARGGSITFSTDVNVDIDGILARIRAKVRSLLQRARVGREVDQVALTVTRIGVARDADFGGIGYTLSPPQKGKYVSPRGGKAVSERSYRVDFGGVDSTLLRYLAEGIRQVFHQESVFVRDDNEGVSFLWFGYSFRPSEGQRPGLEPGLLNEEFQREETPVH